MEFLNVITITKKTDEKSTTNLFQLSVALENWRENLKEIKHKHDITSESEEKKWGLV